MESEPTQGTCDQCYRLHLLADLIRHDDDLLYPDCRGYVSLVVARGDPAEFSRLLAIEAAARAGSAALGSRTTGRRRSCGRRCSAVGHMLVPEDQVLRIISSRRCDIPWSDIATALSVSPATIQRACRRARAPVPLPMWIVREAAPRGAP